MYLVTPEQMRTLEQITDAAGVSYAQMMEHAGFGLAQIIREAVPDGKKIIFLAGAGNNGGDCYVAAYHLSLAGWDVQIIAPFGEPKTEISRNAAEKAQRLAHVRIVPMEESFWNHADVIVDGLFGTGFHGDLPDAMKLIPDPPARAFRIACDIPSGGNAETGRVSRGILKADLTVTFGAVKSGMTQYPLRSCCGEIRIAEIGTPAEVFRAFAEEECLACAPSAEDAVRMMPALSQDAYKNQRGHLLTVAGSVRMRGACVLAATAAMRMGVGLQTVASADEALQTITARIPECMCLPLVTDENGFFRNQENHALLQEYLCGKSALLIGCGMGNTPETKKLTKFLLEKSDCPVVIDADGLNVLDGCIEWIPEGRTILTPHPAEAARLLRTDTMTVQENRPYAAKRLAQMTGAVVILKGAGTIITDGKRMHVCTQGNAGMARAGSGDVLAGMTASLAAQGMPLCEAAWCAAVLHAHAGDLAAEKYPLHYLLPQNIIEALREI